MLKHFTFLLLFAGISTVLSQSLNFVNNANMNVARSGSASATDGANEYIINGFTASQSYTTEIEKYNYANDVWQSFPTGVPTVAKAYANAEIVNNKLYIFNGETTGDANNDKLEIVDLQNGNLTYGTPNPFPVSNAGSSVNGNDIYFFGGNVSGGLKALYSKSVYKYNTVTNQWSQLPDIQEALQTTGKIVNNNLYIIGGYSESNIATEDFETANLSGNLELADWINYAEEGQKYYRGKVYDFNRYTEVTAFTSFNDFQEETNIIWLISPEYQKTSSTDTKNYFLNFDSKDAYNNGALFECYVITNWTGDIKTSSKVLLPAKIATGSTNGYALNFTNSGNLSLADYPNSFRIAFKYTGGYWPLRTTNFQVDNVRIFQANTSKNISKFDIANNAWGNNFATLSKPVSANSLAVNGSNIIVSGDYSEQSFLGLYNPENNDFETITSNNMIGRKNHNSRIVNNQLYLFGGNSNAYTFFDSTQSADLSTLNTVEFKSALEFKIYPNPATDIFYFNNEIEKISVYTMEGRELSVKAESGKANVSKLPIGNYIITGKDKGGKLYKTKLIKK